MSLVWRDLGYIYIYIYPCWRHDIIMMMMICIYIYIYIYIYVCVWVCVCVCYKDKWCNLQKKLFTQTDIWGKISIKQINKILLSELFWLFSRWNLGRYYLALLGIYIYIYIYSCHQSFRNRYKNKNNSHTLTHLYIHTLTFILLKTNSTDKRQKFVLYSLTRYWEIRYLFHLIVNEKKRICRIVDFAFPAEHRVKLKEREKGDKYLDLARELKKEWNI